MNINYKHTPLGGNTSVWDAEIVEGTVTLTVTVQLGGMKLEPEHWHWVYDHTVGEARAVLTPEGEEFVLDECWFGYETDITDPIMDGVGISLEFSGE